MRDFRNLFFLKYTLRTKYTIRYILYTHTHNTDKYSEYRENTTKKLLLKNNESHKCFGVTSGQENIDKIFLGELLLLLKLLTITSNKTITFNEECIYIYIF